MTTFYLGTHHPHWLAQVDVPLFVSRRALERYKQLPRAVTPWALDSGGFSELSIHGAWKLSPADYVRQVRRYRDEIGMLQWAAPQDWMCEPDMLKKTGLTVEEHQRRTVDNFLELRELAPDVPWVPVLQGWSAGSYFHHEEDYRRAGVELEREPLVGIGTVCRRQHTLMASSALAVLANQGIRLHGFGFKLQGLQNAAHLLASADSLAWSYAARRGERMPGCTHKSCANCQEFALQWRRDAVDKIPELREAG